MSGTDDGIRALQPCASRYRSRQTPRWIASPTCRPAGMCATSRSRATLRWATRSGPRSSGSRRLSLLGSCARVLLCFCAVWMMSG
eukprot:1327546-Rhodomonas_salina.1